MGGYAAACDATAGGAISFVPTRLNSEMTDADGLSHAHWADVIAQKSAPVEDASHTALHACREASCQLSGNIDDALACSWGLVLCVQWQLQKCLQGTGLARLHVA